MASKNIVPGGEVSIYDPGEYEGRMQLFNTLSVIAAGKIDDGVIDFAYGVRGVNKTAPGTYEITFDQKGTRNGVMMVGNNNGLLIVETGLLDPDADGFMRSLAALYDLAGVSADGTIRFIAVRM